MMSFASHFDVGHKFWHLRHNLIMVKLYHLRHNLMLGILIVYIMDKLFFKVDRPLLHKLKLRSINITGLGAQRMFDSLHLANLKKKRKRHAYIFVEYTCTYVLYIKMINQCIYMQVSVILQKSSI